MSVGRNRRPYINRELSAAQVREWHDELVDDLHAAATLVDEETAGSCEVERLYNRATDACRAWQLYASRVGGEWSTRDAALHAGMHALASAFAVWAGRHRGLNN